MHIKIKQMFIHSKDNFLFANNYMGEIEFGVCINVTYVDIKQVGNQFIYAFTKSYCMSLLTDRVIII